MTVNKKKSGVTGIWVGLTSQEMSQLSFVAGCRDLPKTKVASELLSILIPELYEKEMLKIKDNNGN